MEKEEKKLNKKKIVKLVIFIILLVLIITGIFIYRDNRTVQNFFDENIFNQQSNGTAGWKQKSGWI